MTPNTTTMCYHDIHTHESVEPPRERETTEIDYSNEVHDLCEFLRKKFTSDVNYASSQPKHHMCMFFNTKTNKMAIGENIILRNDVTKHAEMTALERLGRISTRNRTETYDIVVIRVSRTGTIGTSRPCFHCIQTMMKHPRIRVRNVYYSTNTGTIVREKLSEMLVTKPPFISAGWAFRLGLRKPR